MTFSGLPPPLLILTFEYASSYHVQTLRGVCTAFRQVLDDDESVVWNSMLNTYSTPLVHNRVLWSESVGTTALMVKESVLRHHCVSCRLWFSLRRNELHDLLLCERCGKKQVFRVVNLRKACSNYFLDYQVQKENNLLVKVRKGRSFQVLLNHVRAVALGTYPDGLLQEKMNARFCKAFNTELRKQREKEKRMREISHRFCDVLWESPARVDAGLRNQQVLHSLVRKYGSAECVYGDSMDRKVRASMKSKVVARRLYDYGAMLTYMRKLNLLDDAYEVTQGHRCHPRNIFRHHVNAGLHFYELSRLHADSKEELASRSLEVETYLSLNDLNSARRNGLAVAMCAEESINFIVDDFREFVLHQRGNPVQLARQARERIFLDQNHLAWEMNNFLALGHTPQEAERVGKINVLHRTKGYPPMMRSCVIDLFTSRR